ncbi:GDP-fucose protein O-fucosyltransferase [Arabidopsis thaliana x Arabidopsis arenosa]|uniref:O-fucosyltransferase family protein n=1 Tax=Arabidopsis thaliana x Arabidopsis arenosa TaxID=1240361 RepID=A0A8T2A7R5_9BRAS|nr:GDP-fucose protein O-fucosyltransferase [Arabidopsis thaliana x Arabidopsis arenosa]
MFCVHGIVSDLFYSVGRKRNLLFCTQILLMLKHIRKLKLQFDRLLKALGAPRNESIYIAGGEPYGGSRALEPLAKEFSNLVTKETLAHKGELLPYTNRSSALAAIDYIVSLSSDVFLPSHGGNMAKAMQGKQSLCRTHEVYNA